MIADARFELHRLSQAVVAAYARRWAIVDCTSDEERTLRELNDYLSDRTEDGADRQERHDIIANNVT